jgi:hypothetical protein
MLLSPLAAAFSVAAELVGERWLDWHATELGMGGNKGRGAAVNFAAQINIMRQYV